MTSPTNNSIADRQLQAQWLVSVARDQNRNNFENLFRFFAPRLKSFMRRNGASDAEADEIIQDVMLTVWTKAGQYDPQKASVSTWIFRIARNKRIDAHRRTLKSFVGGEPINDDLLVALDSSHSTNEQIDISNAMEELDKDQRALLKAAYYDGYSHSELAKKLNIPIGTVKSRIRLACQKLKTQLLPQPKKLSLRQKSTNQIKSSDV